MQVLYAADSAAKPLRVYVDPKTNTHEFSRSDAERIAQRLGADGYARVVFGGSTIAEYGADPRHI